MNILQETKDLITNGNPEDAHKILPLAMGLAHAMGLEKELVPIVEKQLKQRIDDWIAAHSEAL